MRGSLNRNGSPHGAKGVSFETATEKEEPAWKREHSTSTSPLVTDSCSESDDKSTSRLVMEDQVHVRVDRADVINE